MSFSFLTDRGLESLGFDDPARRPEQRWPTRKELDRGIREWLTPRVQPGDVVVIFFAGVIEAFAKKRVAGNNPWGVGATTLEWTLSSPPPFHQFETLPRIK